MANKVYVTVKVKLIINLEDGETVDEAISKMDYNLDCNFDYRPDGAENRVVDTEILDHEVDDSK